MRLVRSSLPRLRAHPIGFLWHYVRRHPWGHATVFLSVLVAVACAVSVQYGLKHLIDIIAAGPAKATGLWLAFALLCSLVAADSLLWRVAGWAAAYTFVAVTGDIRRDLFGHLSGHSPSYFAERLPGALASRITATSNAVFTTENTGSWNVLPPVRGSGLLDRLHRFGEPDHGWRAGRRCRVPGRDGVLSGPPRDAACIAALPQRPPRSMVSWSM